MQFIFDLVFLIDYADYFLTYGKIKIIYVKFYFYIAV